MNGTCIGPSSHYDRANLNPNSKSWVDPACISFASSPAYDQPLGVPTRLAGWPGFCFYLVSLLLYQCKQAPVINLEPATTIESSGKIPLPNFHRTRCVRC